jgi:hypothetical protein
MRMSAFLLAMLIPATGAVLPDRLPGRGVQGPPRESVRADWRQCGRGGAGVSQTEGFTLPRQHNGILEAGARKSGPALLDVLPMELDDMKRLVLEKGVVQKVPPTPASAIPGRR